MGRKPSINRDALLDAAEAIVIQHGAKALTIEALALAMGISKGGVQYSYPSKDALIFALVDRSLQHFDALFSPQGQAGGTQLVRNYLAAMRATQGTNSSKLASLMIAYLQNPENLQQTREWYRRNLSKMTKDTASDRRARQAFMAIEGIYSLQMLGVLTPTEVNQGLDDIEALLDQPIA